MSTFGKKIRDLRIARNLTQAQVASGIVLPNNKKLSASAIGMYEQNRRKPSFEVLEAFADFFNVDLNTLSSQSYSTSTPSNFTPKDERDIQKRLQNILNDLDDNASLNFYNGDEEMDEETKELLRISLESSIRLAKSRAKQKFTPNKYKNKDKED